MKKITVAEVRALALRNYNKGGDGVVECYEDSQIQEEIDAGMQTREAWLRSFHIWSSICSDIQNS